MSRFVDVAWLEPGGFSKPVDEARTEFTDGVDLFPLRTRRGFTRMAKEAAPSLAELEHMGPWLQLSKKTGATRPDGTNARRFLGAMINVSFLNKDGKASKAVLEKVRNESEEIAQYLAAGDELVEAGKLSEEDFAARALKPEETVFLLAPAVLTEDDRGLWFHDRIQSSHPEAAPEASDNLPF